MLYIRADMNKTIATGHIMRCLSIADAARRLGEESIFLLADGEAAKLLQQRGYDFIILDTAWNDMESELPKILSVIEEKKIEKLLIDSYQVTETYLSTLRKQVKVCYIDDVNAFDYPVDMLVCYANYYEKFGYTSRLKDTKLCLGTAYAPLRAAFENCPPKKMSGRAEKLLLLSGGTDPYHFLEQMLGKLDDTRYQKVDVICGALNQDYEKLYEKYNGCGGIRIHKQVSDMENYMQEADMAVSAGGSTLYELCACGTPTISYSMADNQLDNVHKFHEDGMIPYAGDLRTPDVAEEVVRLLEELGENTDLRKERSRKMQKMVDGKGALRIADSLIQIIKKGNTTE